MQAPQVEILPHLITQVIFELDSGVACSYCLWRSSMLFSSLLFIFQSKEYPRNVPENPARKFVEKEVCIKCTKKKMGEKPKPCKGGTYNTAERGWFADAVKWTVMVRRVVVKPEKYLKRGLHKADEQITFVKFELGCTRSSLFHCPILIPLAASLSWPRGVEECLSLMCWHPALYMHAQGWLSCLGATDAAGTPQLYDPVA